MTFNFGLQKVGEEEKKSLVSGVFAKVAPKYDLMNNIMSFGIQNIWKKSFIDLISLQDGGIYMDLAAGSGDISKSVLEKAIKEDKKITIHLCDASQEMLDIAKKRFNKSFEAFHSNIHFHTSFAEELSFSENSFDSIFISFGIRNFTNLTAALSKIYSCLKKNGSLYILEFFPDVSKEFGFSAVYSKYLSKIIPSFGKIILGESSPYKYFGESITTFYTKQEFMKLLGEHGFRFFNITNSAFKIVSFFQFKK